MIDLNEQQASEEEEDYDNDENITVQRKAGRPLAFKDLHPTSSLMDEAAVMFQNSDPLQNQPKSSGHCKIQSDVTVIKSQSSVDFYV